MKIKEMIEILQKMPQEKEMYFIWDGAPRSKLQAIWMAKNGDIIAGELDEPVYTDKYRSLNAPSSEEDPYWKPEDDINIINQCKKIKLEKINGFKMD